MRKVLGEENSALLEKIIDSYLSKLMADYFSQTTSDKEAILAEYRSICRLNLELGLDFPGVVLL